MDTHEDANKHGADFDDSTDAQASELCDLLNADLKGAIEMMAREINLAPDDRPCVTMAPRIWLMWEKILQEAGIEPDVGI
jgi:hypothetical protein